MQIRSTGNTIPLRLLGGLANGNYAWLIAFSALVSVSLFVPIVFFQIPVVMLGVALVFVIGVASVFFYKNVFFLLPMLLFVPYWFMFLTLGEWFAIALGIVFLIKSDFSPLFKSEFRPLHWYVFFIVATMPGLFLSGNFGNSAVSYLHVAVVISAAVVIADVIRTKGQFKRLLFVFLFIALSNSLYVLTYRGDEDRFFGFAGVMFIDYAGIGVVACSVLSFALRGRQRILAGVSAVVLFAGLAATQTRNPVLPIVGTWVILGITVFVKNRLFGIKRKKVAQYALVCVAIGCIAGAFLISTNPKVKARIQSGSIKAMVIESETDVGSNSLLTRILIWDTALNAFKAHPFFGIGMFSFPTASQQYNTMNKTLFEMYVRGLSPHLGYLMVLCESGLLGLGVFVLMLVVWFKSGYSSLRVDLDRAKIGYVMAVFGISIYLILSLGVTDAWFYGNGAVVFGMALGLSTSVLRFVNESC